MDFLLQEELQLLPRLPRHSPVRRSLVEVQGEADTPAATTWESERENARAETPRPSAASLPSKSKRLSKLRELFTSETTTPTRAQQTAVPSSRLRPSARRLRLPREPHAALPRIQPRFGCPLRVEEVLRLLREVPLLKQHEARQTQTQAATPPLHSADASGRAKRQAEASELCSEGQTNYPLLTSSLSAERRRGRCVAV